MSTTITSITTETVVPAGGVTPLLAQAVMPSGEIDVPNQAGTISVYGKAFMELPKDSVSSFITIPEGYTITDFRGGHFTLWHDADGNPLVIITARWSTPAPVVTTPEPPQ